ncbi:MAG: HlyD family efflux transporter periplasmic adaptor subunit [Pseudomonadota bacterium]
MDIAILCHYESIVLTSMNHSLPSFAISGAAMDTVVRRSFARRFAWIGTLSIVALVMGIGMWRWMPRGLQVDAGEIRVAIAQHGTFLDDLIVRANAAPLNSVILDAVESGRVEEVFVRDGALLEKGDPLFRLSNPQRQLDLLARQSDQATQISNLSNLRASLEASITDHERRLSDLEFNLAQADKQYARNLQLAGKGFISNVVLEESADKLEQQRHTLDEERNRGSIEMEIKRKGLVQMEQASGRLESGLRLMLASIDALTVRASTAGRLTGFRLQVGEAVTLSQHIGRIDDPAHFKLSADVDEYYLNRVVAGRPGKVQTGDQFYAVEVTRVYPQIDKGRFTIDMVFAARQPPLLNPGQSLDTRITLGDPASALLLPTGAFINDSGGAWVFVVNSSEETAQRRPIRVGRRSNSQIEVTGGLSAGEKVIVSSYARFGHAVHLQLNK